MSLCGCCIRSGSCSGSRVRMKNVTWIDETGRHETFITVAMSEHPEPIWIIAIQHCHEFTSFNTDVILIPRHECVKNNISSS